MSLFSEYASVGGAFHVSHTRAQAQRVGQGARPRCWSEFSARALVSSVRSHACNVRGCMRLQAVIATHVFAPESLSIGSFLFVRCSGPQDKLTEKYSSAAVGGDDNVNLFQMLIQHPFNTEPNDSVVLADQNKQVQQRAAGAGRGSGGRGGEGRGRPLPDADGRDRENGFRTGAAGHGHTSHPWQQSVRIPRGRSPSASSPPPSIRLSFSFPSPFRKSPA